MNVFSIRDIENLTGIKAHTLRIWEQRHNLFNPKRKESKHRFYDSEDLKYLLRIAHLYHHGYKISRIAGLSTEEIRQLALRLRPGQALELQPNPENYEIYINQLTEAALDFDQVAFEKILHHLQLQAGFDRSVKNVLFPLLDKIGALWLAGKTHPCQEHFASALIMKQMVIAVDRVDRPAYTGTRKVLLFTPEAEFHEMPLLFMHYLMKKHGIPTIYMGKNVSLETLQTVCRQQPVTQLYFHLITNLTGCDLHQYLVRLSDLFPDKEIVFSGAPSCLSCRRPVNVRMLADCDAMLAFSK